MSIENIQENLKISISTANEKGSGEAGFILVFRYNGKVKELRDYQKKYNYDSYEFLLAALPIIRANILKEINDTETERYYYKN